MHSVNLFNEIKYVIGAEDMSCGKNDSTYSPDYWPLRLRT